VELGDLKIDSPSYLRGNAYAPTPPSVFDRMMMLLPAPEKYSFVDLGSGKGRVVLMAALRPFKAVVGVEFSSELSAVAETNLVKFRPHVRSSDVRLVCNDAVLFNFPPGPLIVWFYHSFAKEVLARVFERLIQRQHETIFIYYNAHYHELFSECDVLYSDKDICIWKIAGTQSHLSSSNGTEVGDKVPAITRLAGGGAATEKHETRKEIL